MKINLSDVFDELDIENTDRIPGEGLTADYNNDITERVKSNVLTALDIQTENKRKKRLTRSIGRLIAAAAAVAVFASCISVGATVYFKPDSRIAQYLTYSDDVDMNTLGQDVNIKQSYGDYELTLVQVLSDNSTMQLLFESEQIDDWTPFPEEIQIKINGKRYDGGNGFTTRVHDDGYCYVTIEGLRNIKTGDNVEVVVTGIGLYNVRQDKYDESSDDVEMSFDFQANRANVKRNIDVSDAVFGEEEYKIKNCVVSPLGFYFDFTVEETDSTKNLELINAHTDIAKNGEGSSIVVEMKDGTIYSDDLDDCHITVSVGATNEFLGGGIKGNYDAVFDTVINVDEIKSITVSGNVLYQA